MSTNLNVTVLVGNGFDLSAGMKTGTAEFMQFFADKHKSDEGPVGRLAKRILKDDPRNWADFEKRLGEYTQVIEETEDNPAGAALDCKGAIDTALIDFIDEADSETTDEFVKANANSVIGSLAHWFGTLQQREVHSSLGRGPICGVNDASQIVSNKLASNKDIATTYIKSEIQKLFGSNVESDAMGALIRMDILIIYGLSLGESDAQWWSAITSLLKQNTALFVIIASIDVPISGRIPTTYLSYSRQLKGRLFRFGEASDEEIDTLSERVFIIPSEMILQFKETLPRD